MMWGRLLSFFSASLLGPRPRSHVDKLESWKFASRQHQPGFHLDRQIWRIMPPPKAMIKMPLLFVPSELAEEVVRNWPILDVGKGLKQFMRGVEGGGQQYRLLPTRRE
jgi:hypothetical protein